MGLMGSGWLLSPLWPIVTSGELSQGLSCHADSLLNPGSPLLRLSQDDCAPGNIQGCVACCSRDIKVQHAPENQAV